MFLHSFEFQVAQYAADAGYDKAANSSVDQCLRYGYFCTDLLNTYNTRSRKTEKSSEIKSISWKCTSKGYAVHFLHITKRVNGRSSRIYDHKDT